VAECEGPKNFDERVGKAENAQRTYKKAPIIGHGSSRNDRRFWIGIGIEKFEGNKEGLYLIC
jgi:hypothetical protein